MSFISKISEFVSGAGANIIDSLSDTVDRFVTTGEEKEQIKQELLRIKGEQERNQQQFMMKMEELAQKREAQLEESLRKELDAKKEILMAELNQDDLFTKRARPSVIYMGLIFILLELMGIRHIILHYVGIDADIIANSDQIFKMFLGVWGSVIGVYSIGRSAEKKGVKMPNIRGLLKKEAQKDNMPDSNSIVQSLKSKISW